MCVTQEIDSYYCPNCLENMVSVEAGHYLNRFELPSRSCLVVKNVSNVLVAFRLSHSQWGSLENLKKNFTFSLVDIAAGTQSLWISLENLQATSLVTLFSFGSHFEPRR